MFFRVWCPLKGFRSLIDIFIKECLAKFVQRNISSFFLEVSSFLMLLLALINRRTTDWLIMAQSTWFFHSWGPGSDIRVYPGWLTKSRAKVKNYSIIIYFNWRKKKVTGLTHRIIQRLFPPKAFYYFWPCDSEVSLDTSTSSSFYLKTDHLILCS